MFPLDRGMSSRRFNAGWFTIALLAGAGFAHGQNVPDQAASAQEVQRTRLEPFLAQHCFDCHSDDVPKGGLNLRTFSVNVADAEVRRRWVHLSFCGVLCPMRNFWSWPIAVN
jgi:hypothetical protein